MVIKRSKPAGPAPGPGFSLGASSFVQSDNGTEPTRLLTERQRHHLMSLAARVQLPARSTIYPEDAAAEWVWFIGSGVVKAYRDLRSGRRRIAAFLFPDDMFGLAENGRYINTTQTVTASVLYRVRLDTLTETLRRDPELQLQFLRKLTHELRRSQRRGLILARRDAAGRLAMFLSMLEQHSRHRRDGRVGVPMSRSDIADYLGLTLEAVSRATRALRDDEVVQFEDAHTARIQDRQRFDELVRAL